MIDGETLIRVMTSQGFAPTNTHAHFIEFTKTYADAEGRLARAIAQFDRPDSLLGGVRLVGFNVLVQAHVAATIDAVEERAPAVMQPDLVALVNAFDTDAPAPPAVVFERCVECRAPTTEFFVVRGRVLCRGCKEG